MLKNKLCVIFLSLLLILPAYSIPEESVDMEQIPEVNVIDEDYPILEEQDKPEVLPKTPKRTLSQESLKTPISKRQIAMKFIFAMFGVVLSSLIIYIGLTIYNKIRSGITSTEITHTLKGEDASLSTPENLSEAIKTFIEKTKWN